MISILNVSDTVEICVTDKMMNHHFYKTKIQDINLDDEFHTMVPSSSTGRPVIFFKDTVYELYAKFDDGVIVWRIKYLGTERLDNIPSCKFKVIDGPEITQRREYFRQAVSAELEFTVIDEYDPHPSIGSEAYHGRVVDLSGGGCAFMSNDDFMMHSRLSLRFSFRGEDFEFWGDILDRIDYIRTRADWRYKYRIRWVSPPAKAIDKLVKLIFEQQKEYIKEINGHNLISEKLGNFII